MAPNNRNNHNNLRSVHHSNKSGFRNNYGSRRNESGRHIQKTKNSPANARNYYNRRWANKTQKEANIEKAVQGVDRNRKTEKVLVTIPNEDQNKLPAQGSSSDDIYVVDTMYVSVPLIIFCKRFTALVNSCSSITKIGSEVANRAVANGFEKKSKILILGPIQKRIETVTIPLGTRMTRLKSVECVIDPTASPLSVTLGLQALMSFGYRSFIDQVPTSNHRVKPIEIPIEADAKTEKDIPVERFVEDDVLALLTAAERKEMESWD